MTTWAILLGAGSGTRFGAQKQFLDLAGARIIDRAIHGAHDAVDAVVLVLPAGESWVGPPVHAVVEGGAQRSDSVRAGLAVIPPEVEVIVVHDVARPLATRATYSAVIDAVKAGADGAVPGIAIPDTIKRVSQGMVVETLNRSELVAVQTPQAFNAAKLRDAHLAGGDATDDAGLIEAIGGTVIVVQGDALNQKITEGSDLARLEALLAERSRSKGEAGESA
jgi:2-C-methyl-D-erythritol 4-phosphate cytidylyltransferase